MQSSSSSSCGQVLPEARCRLYCRSCIIFPSVFFDLCRKGQIFNLCSSSCGIFLAPLNFKICHVAQNKLFLAQGERDCPHSTVRPRNTFGQDLLYGLIAQETNTRIVSSDISLHEWFSLLKRHRFSLHFQVVNIFMRSVIERLQWSPVKNLKERQI